MEQSFYRYILKHSARDQIFLILLTVASMPIVYVSLDIPKRIVNEAIGGQNFPQMIMGFELAQIPYLFMLCGLYLILVIINGGFKYVINVYSGTVGERMLRRFRYELYSRVLRFPLPHFKRTSQGEIIPMITSETQPLGEFIGESFSLPALMGGILLTYLGFIFVQDPLLGAAAIALYPIQMYIIPKLQRKVNALNAERVRTIRKVANRISSGFSSARRHPVTRKVVAHHGVDFAAASGTPVTATADGRVIRQGWDGALGQAVRLRHGGEYVTVYGHLRGFARGIAPGVEVLQGQVIGYVGSTGRATGPHLHYTVLKYGRPINPMHMKNPAVDPLEDHMLPWLAESRRQFQPVLEAIHTAPRADVATRETLVDATTVLSGS